MNGIDDFNSDFNKAVKFFFGERNVSYKDMCEKIVEAKFLQKNGKFIENPEEIYNYSPTGELIMIPIWFIDAYNLLKDNKNFNE